jgi:hypothetical protein
VRFDQSDHARPRVGARFCWLHALNALVLHWLIHSETLAALCIENDHDVRVPPIAQLRVLQTAGENPDLHCHHRHNVRYSMFYLISGHG